MKRKVNYLVLSAIGIGMVSCGGDEEVTPTNDKAEMIDSAIVESVKVIDPPEEHIDKIIESRFHYDEDWDRFKEAVISKNIQGVSAFASSDAIDAELLVDAFSDSDFLEQLRVATYDDLTTDIEGEEVLLVFSATMSGSDEEGNEYESGVYLYFSQGENSLLLENFLAAG